MTKQLVNKNLFENVDQKEWDSKKNFGQKKYNKAVGS